MSSKCHMNVQIYICGHLYFLLSFNKLYLRPQGNLLKEEEGVTSRPIRSRVRYEQNTPSYLECCHTLSLWPYNLLQEQK